MVVSYEGEDYNCFASLFLNEPISSIASARSSVRTAPPTCSPAKLLQEESFASAGYPYFNRGKKIGVKPYCDEGEGEGDDEGEEGAEVSDGERRWLFDEILKKKAAGKASTPKAAARTRRGRGAP